MFRVLRGSSAAVIAVPAATGSEVSSGDEEDNLTRFGEPASCCNSSALRLAPRSSFFSTYRRGEHVQHIPGLSSSLSDDM